MVELVGSKVSKEGTGIGGVNEGDKLSSSDIRRSMLGQYRTPKVCYEDSVYAVCECVSCR